MNLRKKIMVRGAQEDGRRRDGSVFVPPHFDDKENQATHHSNVDRSANGPGLGKHKGLQPSSSHFSLGALGGGNGGLGAFGSGAAGLAANRPQMPGLGGKFSFGLRAKNCWK